MLVSFAFCIAVMTSCLNGDEYPLEPDIKYVSAVFKDTLDQLGNVAYLGTITFEFTDGDGDIGTETGDTTNNMFVDEIELANGIRQTPVPHEYKIPYITPGGSNQSLKGEIDVEVEIFKSFNPPTYDTVIYEIYIVDRANNKSNIITTPIIAL